MKKRILSISLTLALPIAAQTPARASYWADDIMADLVGRGVMDALPEDPDAPHARRSA
jgi:hypothetical protein